MDKLQTMDGQQTKNRQLNLLTNKHINERTGQQMKGQKEIWVHEVSDRD